MSEFFAAPRMLRAYDKSDVRLMVRRMSERVRGRVLTPDTIDVVIYLSLIVYDEMLI